MEIIEFPSVLYKIDHRETITFVDEFHEYVRPVNHPILTEFCTELTGIKQETVDSADILENVWMRHSEWLRKHANSERVVIMTCGAWDLRTMLPLEVKNKGLQRLYAHHYKQYCNIKEVFQMHYGRKAGGMTDMLTKLNIELTGRHHSGIDDTRNIAKIFLEMKQNGLTSQKIISLVHKLSSSGDI